LTGKLQQTCFKIFSRYWHWKFTSSRLWSQSKKNYFCA